MMPRGHVVKPLIDRVLDRVRIDERTQCWIFTGAINEAGYGIVGKGGRGSGNDRAHRVTYRHFCGEIPGGLIVCHRCDVPACCNPEHLFLGTHKDNSEDCWSKGRASHPPRNLHLRGENHYAAKLTTEQVRMMREMRHSGATFQEIADRFDVSNSYAWRVVSGNARAQA